MNKLEVLKNYLNYVTTYKYIHNWNNPSNCHCGMLLKSLDLGKYIHTTWCVVNNVDLTTQDNCYFHHYRKVFNIYRDNLCDVTNLNFTEVVDKLVGIGFTLDELVDLEHLQDKRFIDLELNDYQEITKIDNLIIYLTNWINYEEQLVNATIKSTETVKVSQAGL